MTNSPVIVEGRTRYADSATTEVLVRRYEHEDPIMVIHGGMIEERRDGEFILSAKHPTATDEEHDAAYVAYLLGAGLRYRTMFPDRVRFTGVLLDARYYAAEPEPTDTCDGERCDGPHPFLEFTPPQQKWKPANYFIEVIFTPTAQDAG